MKLNFPQLKIIVLSIQHLIQCEEKQVKTLEETLGKEIFELNSLGRVAKDENEKNRFWLQADKKDLVLNSEVEQWTYQKFYLRQFLEYLQKQLRQVQKGGKHAIAV